MRISICTCVAALAVTGCHSAAAVQPRGEQPRPADAGALSRSPREGPARSPAVPFAGNEASAGAAAAGGSSCSALASAVVRLHPRTRALRARGRAAMARSRAEAALPSPRASLELWDFPVADPSRAGREGMYMLGVGQEFPAPGARGARSRAEAQEAQVAAGELAEAGRELWAEAARACTSWSAAEALRQQLLAHRALLGEMREAMVARYQTGGETLGAIARAEAELAAADRHVAEAEEEVAVARDTLVALAGEGVSIASQPPPQPGPRHPPELATLVELATSARGSSLAAVARRRGAQARAEAAAAEARSPSFDVRATYMQAPQQRPGLGAMISASLPWLWGGAGERRAAARLEAEAAEAEAASTMRSVRVEVARAAGQVRALSRSLALLLEREIPAARLALEAERAALRSGGFNLASWIQAAHAVRQAHVDEARVRGALASAWIELEASVGRPLATGQDGSEQQP